MIYKFTAEWCGSCLITNKNFKKVSAKYQENGLELKFQEVDIDNESPELQNLKEKYKAGEGDGVLPVLVFADKNGQEIHRSEGEMSQNQLIKAIDTYLKKQGKETPSQNFLEKTEGNFFSKLGSIFS